MLVYKIVSKNDMLNKNTATGKAAANFHVLEIMIISSFIVPLLCAKKTMVFHNHVTISINFSRAVKKTAYNSNR